MNKTIWNKWQSDWTWIMTIAENREWDYRKIIVKDPVSLEVIKELEKKLNIEYPADFKQVLSEYSSGIDFYWHMGKDQIDFFRNIFSGGSEAILWDYAQLERMYLSCLDWIETCFPDPNNEYDKIWHNKIPFLEVGNGDLIAFDASEYSVIYLSHDGDGFHGSRLAENFIEFMTNWSNLGCIGTEDWVLEIFYDSEKKKLMSNSPLIDKWKKALIEE